MLCTPQYTMLKLSKTPSPQKLFPSDFITLYISFSSISVSHCLSFCLSLFLSGFLSVSFCLSARPFYGYFLIFSVQISSPYLIFTKVLCLFTPPLLFILFFPFLSSSLFLFYFNCSMGGGDDT